MQVFVDAQIHTKTNKTHTHTHRSGIDAGAFPRLISRIRPQFRLHYPACPLHIRFPEEERSISVFVALLHFFYGFNRVAIRKKGGETDGDYAAER